MKFHLDPANRAGWLSGDAQVAAQAYSQVPTSLRPSWAGAVLNAALPAVAPESPLRDLAKAVIADTQRGDRDDSRALFEEIRTVRIGATLDDSQDELARLAEFTCKVAHNATSSSAPFDARSGVVLIEQAASVARVVPELETSLWLAVCRR